MPAAFLMLCGYFGNSIGWAIAFLSLSVGSSGFVVAGNSVNILDIAPKYAGILMGISNTFGTIPGFLSPQIAKLIAKEVNIHRYLIGAVTYIFTQPAIEPCGNSCEDPFTIDIYRQEWTLVFIIATEIYVFGAITYIILESGKKQPWADGRHTKNVKHLQTYTQND